MTKDYTGKTWNVLVDERNENRTKAAGSIPQVLQPLGHRKLGSHERLVFLSKLLQVKILERTKNGSTEIVDAYKLFGRPQNGVTFDLFSQLLSKVGLYLEDNESRIFYNHLDGNSTYRFR